jgi:hypothetical protein
MLELAGVDLFERPITLYAHLLRLPNPPTADSMLSITPYSSKIDIFELQPPYQVLVCCNCQYSIHSSASALITNLHV